MSLFSRSNSRSHLGLFLVLLLMFSAGLGLYTSLRGVAQAAGPHIWLSQKVGPPTASIQVHGYGFGHSETVLVDFDTTPVGTATTDATGKFVLRITVPRAALPGTHTVQATGQSSGLTISASFLVRTDWSQLGFGPRHAGYNPYENVLSSSNVSALTLDWSYPVAGGGGRSYLAAANGVIYVSADKLYALDAVTGALKWSNSIGGGSYPAVANGVVYVAAGSPTYVLYALNAMTGALKWSFTMDTDPIYNFTSSPVVVNGVVYIGAEKLYALDAVTGALKWSFSMWVNNSPAVAGGVVYVVSSACYTVVALDAMTGVLKWTSSTGLVETSYCPSPAVANGVVYVSADKLYALDAVTGVLKWSFATGNAGPIDTPAVANGLVYVGAYDNKLYAVNVVTGAFKWSFTTGNYIVSSPAVANGVVYVSSDQLYVLDALTGTLKWSYSLKYGIYGSNSSPAVANGVIYVGSEDDNMYAFHLPGMS